VLARDGIKPQPKKVQAILMLPLPQNVKQLHRFLDMPSTTDTSGQEEAKFCHPSPHQPGWECGHTKDTRANKPKCKSWHWDEVHQTTFDNTETTINKDVILTYPDYSQGFKIYTDSSKFQLGVVIYSKQQTTGIFQQKPEPITANIQND
jgi:hypothetical protein